jgi:hypothetical protein
MASFRTSRIVEIRRADLLEDDALVA